MKAAGRLALVLLLVVGCAQLGCSLAFVKRLPPASERQVPANGAPECSYRPTGPIVDTVFASGGLAAVALMLAGMAIASDMAEADGSESGNGELVLPLAGALAVTGVLAASAIWGFGATRECREYRRAWQLGAPSWAPAQTSPPSFGSYAPQP